MFRKMVIALAAMLITAPCLRADDKTAEKTRRALAVALALIDERAAPPPAPAPAAARQPADEPKLET